MTLFYFLLSAFISLNTFALEPKEDLFLVVGSTRADWTTDNFIGSRIHANESTDCTHQHTWGGKATTFDVEPCENDCGPHLQGNATTYDFSRFNIRNVYLERVDTASHAVAEAGNLIGAILKNLKPHMEQGARLEIELDPFLCFGAYPSGSQTKDDLEESRRRNPFQGLYR